MGVVVPGCELVQGKTIGSMPFFFFRVFFRVVLKKLAVSNPNRLFNLDICQTNSDISYIYHFFSGNETNSIWEFYCWFKKTIRVQTRKGMTLK